MKDYQGNQYSPARISVSLAEDKNFAAGYEAIFGAEEALGEADRQGQDANIDTILPVVSDR